MFLSNRKLNYTLHQITMEIRYWFPLKAPVVADTLCYTYVHIWMYMCKAPRLIKSFSCTQNISSTPQILTKQVYLSTYKWILSTYKWILLTYKWILLLTSSEHSIPLFTCMCSIMWLTAALTIQLIKSVRKGSTITNL